MCISRAGKDTFSANIIFKKYYWVQSIFQNVDIFKNVIFSYFLVFVGSRRGAPGGATPHCPLVLNLLKVQAITGNCKVGCLELTYGSTELL